MSLKSETTELVARYFVSLLDEINDSFEASLVLIVHREFDLFRDRESFIELFVCEKEGLDLPDARTYISEELSTRLAQDLAHTKRITFAHSSVRHTVLADNKDFT